MNRLYRSDLNVQQSPIRYKIVYCHLWAMPFKFIRGIKVDHSYTIIHYKMYVIYEFVFDLSQILVEKISVQQRGVPVRQIIMPWCHLGNKVAPDLRARRGIVKLTLGYETTCFITKCHDLDNTFFQSAAQGQETIKFLNLYFTYYIYVIEFYLF